MFPVTTGQPFHFSKLTVKISPRSTSLRRYLLLLIVNFECVRFLCTRFLLHSCGQDYRKHRVLLCYFFILRSHQLIWRCSPSHPISRCGNVFVVIVKPGGFPATIRIMYSQFFWWLHIFIKRCCLLIGNQRSVEVIVYPTCPLYENRNYSNQTLIYSSKHRGSYLEREKHRNIDKVTF